MRLVVANTHLDNVGRVSRERGVGVVRAEVERVRRRWALKDPADEEGEVKGEMGLPVLLTGDFNSFHTDRAYRLMQEAGFVDARDCVETRSRYGDGKTFTAFGRGQDVDEQGRIDFVWLGMTGWDDTEIGKVGHECDGDHDNVFKEDDEHVDNEAGRGKISNCKWGVKGYAVLPNQFGDDEVYCSDHRCVVVDVNLKLN